MKKLSILFCIAASVLAFSTCGNGGSTPTQGKLKIYIDESYQPLLTAEVEAFEGLYKNSELDDRYKPEGDVVRDFLADSCRMVLLGRDLTEQEKNFLKSKKSFPVSTRIGVDAMAFITHKENPLKNLTMNELKNIFSGTLRNWKQLDASIKDKSPQDTTVSIVFDNERSCNVRMVKEKLLAGGNLPDNIFAVHSNAEVVDYVSKNKHAIGIIGVNWISDAEDTLTQNFLSKVNVLAIESEKEPGEFVQPYQAYIYNESYPFCRNMYLINGEGRTGLGTGFAAFVAGEKGQLIILKAGMVPATQPVRMVTISKD